MITERIEQHPQHRDRSRRGHAQFLAERRNSIIATGPLTSDALTTEIMRLTGDDQLYFYDAIAPIVAADSIDMSIAFKAARYGKGGDDYINCPMDREEYEMFYRRVDRGQVGSAKAV